MNTKEWSDFVGQISKKVYNYLLKILRNPEDAEDILQSSLAALFQVLYRIPEESYEAYLYRTAYHKALNLIRSRKYQKKLRLEMEQKPVKEETLPIDKQKRIIDTFKKLTPKHAMALELQFFQKKSYKEISEIMQLSCSAVESLLVRAKREFRQYFMQEDELNCVKDSRESKK